MKPKRLFARFLLARGVAPSLGIILPSLAIWAILAGLTLTSAASVAAPQLSAPASPAEQQKLKERVDALESQLKEAQAKADRAAMEKDYTERIQKEVNAYYEKAFNTQLATVTIIALIVGVIGKFGVDHIVQSKLTEASGKLREEFANQLAQRTKELQESNEKQMKKLESDLTVQFQGHTAFVQGIALGSTTDDALALDCFRDALISYKECKARNLIPEKPLITLLHNILGAIENIRPSDLETYVRAELAKELYNGLEREFAMVAIEKEAFLPFIRARFGASPTGPDA